VDPDAARSRATRSRLDHLTKCCAARLAHPGGRRAGAERSVFSLGRCFRARSPISGVPLVKELQSSCAASSTLCGAIPPPGNRAGHRSLLRGNVIQIPLPSERARAAQESNCAQLGGAAAAHQRDGEDEQTDYFNSAIRSHAESSGGLRSCGNGDQSGPRDSRDMPASSVAASTLRSLE
jgi:hypothetical protein